MNLIFAIGFVALFIGILAGIFSLVMWFLNPLDVLEKVIEDSANDGNDSTEQ